MGKGKESKHEDIRVPEKDIKIDPDKPKFKEILTKIVKKPKKTS